MAKYLSSVTLLLIFNSFAVLSNDMTETADSSFMNSSVLHNDKPIIILKLDDLRDYNLDEFAQIVDILAEKNIKGSFGINGQYLVDYDADDEFIQQVKRWSNSGNIEIWHHGWDHSRAADKSWSEYSQRENDSRAEYADLGPNSNYQRQFKDFANTQNIVKQKLGITMRSFGSPYNQNDDTFIDVVDQFPEIKVLMFPRTSVNQQLALSIKNSAGRLNIEQGTGNVDFDYFTENYHNYDQDMDYAVLQGHPGNFDRGDFADFIKICDYLIAQGHQFMTPYQYYQHLQTITDK